MAQELDVLNTQYGRDVAVLFNGLFRLGNQGETVLEKLTYNTNTKKLRGSVRATFAHSWGTISWTDYFSIPPVDNEEDIGVSATAVGEFLFDLESMRALGGLRLPLGERSVSVLGQTYTWDFGDVRISVDQIERILGGDLTALVEALPTLGLFTKDLDNDYLATLNTLVGKYGPHDFYLSSKDFVDKLKPSQGINYAISLIVTAGAAAPTIMRSVGELAAAELNGLSNWLQAQGIANAISVANAILKGQAVQLPAIYLALKWTAIRYRSRSLFNNEIPVTPWISENHGAFYVVAKPRELGTNSNIDNGGFDVGPYGGQDFPENQVDGEMTPDGQSPTFFPGVGIDATDPNASFQVVVNNRSRLTIRVVLLRGANNPSFWSATMLPGTNESTFATGISERIVGVWESEHGRLVLMVPAVIDKNTTITIGRDAITNRYWCSVV